MFVEFDENKIVVSLNSENNAEENLMEVEDGISFELLSEFPEYVYQYNGENFVRIKNPKYDEILNTERLNELERWFDFDYSRYEQMLTRRSYLGISDTIVDDFRNKTYSSLTELYNEAEVVAKEIKELRG